jgi:ABC-type phosphate transport system permease subunit
MVLGNANRLPLGFLVPTAALPTEIVIDMAGATQGSLLQHVLFAMALLLLMIAMGLILLTKVTLARR